MRGRPANPVEYNADLIQQDMVAKGWNPTMFGRHAGCSRMAVTRFLSGEVRTAAVAKKLAKALGHGVSRYIVPAKAVA